MPSPRKRRLKRAAGVTLGKGHKITKAQGADKQFIRSLVSLNGAKSRRAGAPFVHGQKPADGDFAVLSELIKTTAELDMQATCRLALSAALTADDDHITLEDASGTKIKILAVAEAEGVVEGAEVLDNEGKSLVPKTIIAIVPQVAENAIASAERLLDIINNSELKIHAAQDNNVEADIHLAQEIAGPAGNKDVVLSAAGSISFVDVAGDADAARTGFTGGVSAKDALHYFAEDAPQGAGAAFAGQINAQHGVLWLENPRHGLNGLVDLSAAAKNVRVVAKIPDGALGALEAGAAADRLHLKYVMKGGAIANAALPHEAADPLNAAHPGFVSEGAPGAAAEGAIALSQKIIAGDKIILVDPAAPAAGNNEKDEDFLPSKDSGMIVHWYLERKPA